MQRLDKLQRERQKIVWDTYTKGLYSEKIEAIYSYYDLFLKIELFRLYEWPVKIRLFIVDSETWNQFLIYKKIRNGEDVEALEDFTLRKCQQFANFYREK